MNKNRVFRSRHKNVNGEKGGWDQVLAFTDGLRQIVAPDDDVHVPVSSLIYHKHSDLIFNG